MPAHAPPSSPVARGLMWFRRDLRTDDNAALSHALRSCQQVWCVFVFDTTILNPLPRADRRVEFIRESLVEVDARLHQLGLSHGHPGVHLLVSHGDPVEHIPLLARHLGVQGVWTNHDDEPAARARDARVRGHLAHHGVMLHTHKDHVVRERDEVLTQQGRPFSVFTPYRNAWMKTLKPDHLQPHPSEAHAAALAASPWPDAPLPMQPLWVGVPTLAELGFEPTNLSHLKMPCGMSGGHSLLQDFVHRIDQYAQARDFPAVKGPSYLSTHLRFGTVSIRRLAGLAQHLQQQSSPGAGSWLNELVWRDFYHQILFHHPHVVVRAFKPEYDAIRWAQGPGAQALFTAWCEGRTGYPLVDAAMHQLNQTGYMHNRLRMVTASFLTKDLGLDWRWGERYFAERLNDFDLAANNGGWQWAASTGCDAQPYFRIFNPVSQSEKFDPDGKFIRRYLPVLADLPNAAIHAPWQANPLELATANVRLGDNYPLPVVDHAQAREATLARYAVVKKP